MVTERRVETGITERTMKDGTVVYSIRDHSRPTTPRLSFPTLDEARAAKKRQRGKPSRSRAQRRDNLPIDRAFLAAWLEYLRRNEHLAESTVHGYRKAVNYGLASWAERHRWTAANVTLEDIQAYCDAAEEGRLGHGAGGHAAYTTAAKVSMTLCRTLVSMRFRDDNPTAGGALDAQEDRKSVRSLEIRERLEARTKSTIWVPTADELEALLEHVKSPLHKAWFRVLANTGMRPSEAAGLQWDRDVFLDEHFIRTNEPLVEVGGRRFLYGVDVNHPNAAHDIAWRRSKGKRAGKNKTWRRNVTIFEQLDETMRDLEELRKPGVPWVFPGLKSAKATESVLGSFPISYDWTQTVFRKAIEDVKLDLEGLRQYDLRHYHASNLLLDGFSMTEVAMELGDMERTIRHVYGHVVQGSSKDKRLRREQETEARRRRAAAHTGAADPENEVRNQVTERIDRA